MAKTRKTKSVKLKEKSIPQPLTPNFFWQIKNSLTKTISDRRPSKLIYLAFVILGLSLLIAYKKSWLIAATVNNSIISNFEVLSQLNKQYRDQVLNQLINEKILTQEAQKKGIRIQESEVDGKITALEKNVGGKDILDSLLAQQGQTRQGLRDQLKLQIMIEKLYASEATVSAVEVAQFIEQNSDQLQATDSAGQAQEAKEILEQRKLGTIFNEKFQQLKQQAKVQIF